MKTQPNHFLRISFLFGFLMGVLLLPGVQAADVDSTYRPCAFDEVLDSMRANDSTYVAYLDQLDEDINTWIDTSGTEQRGGACPTEYWIPVVVHVIFDQNNPVSNISYDQIQTQINALNAAFEADYAAYNLQTHGPHSTSTCIHFCLATNPQGPASWTNVAEPGVMRHSVVSPSAALNPPVNATNATLLNLTHQNCNTWFRYGNYLNIWVVESIVGAGVAFATFPPLANECANDILDGVVINYDIFGDNTLPGNNFQLVPEIEEGKILAHEVGHYLGLFHTHAPNVPFFSGPFQVCSGMGGLNCGIPGPNSGDRVCDTPPCWLFTSSDAAANCFAPNSCSEQYFPTGGPDHADMVENYLSYSFDDCMNTFTFDQENRMMGALTINAIRFNLWQPGNLAATGILNATNDGCLQCDMPDNIVFTSAQPCPGSNVQFTTPGEVSVCPANYTWTFQGGIPAISNIRNPVVTYATPGLYTVTLSADFNGTVVNQNTVIDVRVPTATITTQAQNGVCDRYVCDGAIQMIPVALWGEPPFSVTLTDGVNQVVFNNIEETNVDLPFTISNANPDVWVQAMNDANCNGNGLGRASFCALTCQANLVFNGDFTLGNNGFNSDHTFDPIYGAGNYNVGDFSQINTPGTWPAIALLPPRGVNLILDGTNTAVNAGPPAHTSLWCTDNANFITFVAGRRYYFEFYTTGGFFVRHSQYNNNIPIVAFPQNGPQLELQISVNGNFNAIPTVFTSPSTGPITWHQHTAVWTATASGTVPVCINQVNNFSGTQFGYDYFIDDIVIREMTGQEELCCVPNFTPDPQTPQNGDILWDNISTSTLAYNNLSNYNNTLVIEGTVTVDANFTFFNCPNIVLNPDARIVVNNGATLITLTIDNSTMKAACECMWDEVYLNGPNAALVIDNSLIRDAEMAVHCEGGAIVDIDNSTLQDNYRHVMMENYTTAFLGHFWGNTFETDATFTSYGSPLLAPHLQEITRYAMQIDDCVDVTVGDNPGTPATENTFQRFELAGVLATEVNTNLSIFNNRFLNSQHFGFAGSAYGVYVDDAGTVNLGGYLGGTGPVPAAGNYFGDLWYGVYIQDAEPEIVDNRLNGLSFGITTEQCNSTINIDENDIGTSAPVSRGILVLDNPSVTSTLITNNDLNMQPNALFGIHDDNVPSSATYRTVISDNDIYGSQNGIQVTNQIDAQIDDNLVEYAFNANGLTIGIRLNNCTDATVYENEIYTNTGVSPTNFHGIGVDISNGTHLCNNRTEGLDEGIWFRNLNAGSELHLNRMFSNVTGLHLSDGAQLGTQGYDNGGGDYDPWDNEWSGNTTNDTWTSNNTDGTQSTLVVQGTTPGGSNFYPGLNNNAGGLNVDVDFIDNQGPAHGNYNCAIGSSKTGGGISQNPYTPLTYNQQYSNHIQGRRDWLNDLSRLNFAVYSGMA